MSEGPQFQDPVVSPDRRLHLSGEESSVMSFIASALLVTVAYFEDTMTNAIGWCCRTHNLFRGCSPVSEACRFCYAILEGAHQILMKSGSPYRRIVKLEDGVWKWTGVVEPTGLGVWMAPFQTRKRWLLFANSMSDVFHKNLSDEQILFALRLMWRARAHVWQVLTKRAERMASVMSRLHLFEGELHLAPLPLEPSARFVIPNLWLGVTAENQLRIDERLPFLAATLAVVRFVSIEPLLGPPDLSNFVGGFEWIIVGGESGDHFRPMREEWACAVRDFCAANGVAFFFKQHAGRNPQCLPKTLGGISWREFPRVELQPPLTDAERKAMREWVASEYKNLFPSVIDCDVSNDGPASNSTASRYVRAKVGLKTTLSLGKEASK